MKMREKITNAVVVVGFIALCIWVVTASNDDALYRAKQFDTCNTGDEYGCREAILDQYRASLNPSAFGGKGPYTLRMKELQETYFAATGKRITPLGDAK